MIQVCFVFSCLKIELHDCLEIFFVILVTAWGPDCAKYAFAQLPRTRGPVTKQAKSDASITYLRCRMDKDDITLPRVCRSGHSYDQKKCIEVIHEKELSSGDFV